MMNGSKSHIINQLSFENQYNRLKWQGKNDWEIAHSVFCFTQFSRKTNVAFKRIAERKIITAEVGTRKAKKKCIPTYR